MEKRGFIFSLSADRLTDQFSNLQNTKLQNKMISSKQQGLNMNEIPAFFNPGRQSQGLVHVRQELYY